MESVRVSATGDLPGPCVPPVLCHRSILSLLLRLDLPSERRLETVPRRETEKSADFNVTGAPPLGMGDAG